MGYQVGDTVQIKENAKDIFHEGINFTPEMEEFCGKSYVVREITGKGCYKLEGVKSDNPVINLDGYWAWVEEWLEEPNELSDINESEIMSLFEA